MALLELFHYEDRQKGKAKKDIKLLLSAFCLGLLVDNGSLEVWKRKLTLNSFIVV